MKKFFLNVGKGFLMFAGFLFVVALVFLILAGPGYLAATYSAWWFSLYLVPVLFFFHELGSGND